MYAALLGVAVAAGAPPLFSALMLGFFGNLLASTTHYSSGPAPIFMLLAMYHRNVGGL